MSKNNFGLRETKIQKKTIFESAPWTVDFIKLIICGGCHSVTVSAFCFLYFDIWTKDTKMTKFITYRNVPKIFEILNFRNYSFYPFKWHLLLQLETFNPELNLSEMGFP